MKDAKDVRRTKDVNEERMYELPLEMSAEVAEDFGISKEALRAMRVGARKTRGIFVPVSRKIYEAYMRPVWREAKREERRAPVVSLERVREEYELEIPAACDVAETVEAVERAALVRAALLELCPKDRKILTLFAEGHTTAEMAKAMGLTERAVRYRKRAAMGKMRSKLLGILSF